MSIRRLRFGLRSKIIFVIVAGVLFLELLGNSMYYVIEKRLLLRQLEHQHVVFTAEVNQAIADFSNAVPPSKNNSLQTPVQHFMKALMTSDSSLLSIVKYPETSNSRVLLDQKNILCGSGTYEDPARDELSLQTAIQTQHPVQYIDYTRSTVLLKTFVPGQLSSGFKYVDEYITNYGLAVQSELHQQIKNSIILSILVTLFSFGVGYLLGWYITSPLLKIHKRIQDLKAFEDAKPIRLQRNDEIGDLAQDVDAMSLRLTRHFHRMIHDERSSSMKYLGMVSHALIHELRNPANASRSLLKLLHSMQPFNDQTKETLNHITTSIEHLNNILDDFSRLIHEGKPLEFGEFDITEIVQQAVDVCTPLAQQRGLLIKIEDDPGQHIARVDIVKLRLIIINLIKNGLDAMQQTDNQDHTIHINVAKLQDLLTIDVTDHGPGIPEERWTEIFMPFKSTKEHGFGLGLSLSSILIMGMGGKIYVEQSSPAGTTIRVTLPSLEVAGTRDRLFVGGEQTEIRTNYMNQTVHNNEGDK
jgi:signal transduction histidine kinase